MSQCFICNCCGQVGHTFSQNTWWAILCRESRPCTLFGVAWKELLCCVLKPRNCIEAGDHWSYHHFKVCASRVEGTGVKHSIIIFGCAIHHEREASEYDWKWRAFSRISNPTSCKLFCNLLVPHKFASLWNPCKSKYVERVQPRTT